MKWFSKKQLLKTSQIEKICRDYFDVDIKVSTILINNTNTGNDSFTSVFQNNHNELYALCVCEKPLLLMDIKSIINKMGIKADIFYPPKDDEQYFNNYAKKIFESVFPGRKSINDQDYSFYKTYAPYSPALMKISQIKGDIKHFDETFDQWKSIMDFSYYRVKIGE